MDWRGPFCPACYRRLPGWLKNKLSNTLSLSESKTAHRAIIAKALLSLMLKDQNWGTKTAQFYAAKAVNTYFAYLRGLDEQTDLQSRSGDDGA